MSRDSPGYLVATTLSPNAGVPGSIPGSGTGSHMPQLRIFALQLSPGTAK